MRFDPKFGEKMFFRNLPFLLVATFQFTGCIQSHEPNESEPGPTPVAYYKLDGNAKDETGNYSGTIYGSPVAVNDRNGNPNSALSFGDGNYITLPNIGLTGEVSVFGWVKMGLGGSNIVAILSQGSNSGLRWHIEAQENYLVYYDRRGDDNFPYLKDATNGLDTWFYFGVVSSPSYPVGAKVRMYLNGKPYGAVSSRPIDEIQGIPLNIGRYFGSNWLPCVGAVDEVRLYKMAFSDAEVEVLYNSTK